MLRTTASRPPRSPFILSAQARCVRAFCCPSHTAVYTSVYSPRATALCVAGGACRTAQASGARKRTKARRLTRVSPPSRCARALEGTREAAGWTPAPLLILRPRWARHDLAQGASAREPRPLFLCLPKSWADRRAALRAHSLPRGARLRAVNLPSAPACPRGQSVARLHFALGGSVARPALRERPSDDPRLCRAGSAPT